MGVELGSRLCRRGFARHIPADAAAHRGAIRPQTDQRLDEGRSIDRREDGFHPPVARVAAPIKGVDDLLRGCRLHRQEGIVGLDAPPLRGHYPRELRHRAQRRIAVGECLEANAQRVQTPHPIRRLLACHHAHERAGEAPVQTLVDFRYPRYCREPPIIFGVIAPYGTDVIERARLEADHVIARDQLGMGGFRAFFGHHRLVEPGRQDVDDVHGLGEFLVLFRRDFRRNEDAEMADRLMQGVDDGLPVGDDLLVATVEIKDPAQRLLRRRDVVAPRAEDHDRRFDVSQVDANAVRGSRLT